MRLAAAKEYLRSLHRVLGLSVGLWAVVMGLTGTILVFSHEIDAALNPHLLRVEPRTGPWDVDGALAAVRARFPGAPVDSIRFPRRRDEALQVWIGEDAGTRVYLDPFGARILGVRSKHEGAIAFLRDLHMYLLAGETGETISGFLGLLLIAILATGLMLWWPKPRRLAGALKIRWHLPLLPRMYDLHRVSGAVTALFLLVPIVTGVMLVFHKPTTAWLIAGLGGPALELPKTLSAPAGASRQPVSRWLASARRALPEARPVSVRFPKGRSDPAVIRMHFPVNPHPNGRTFVAIDPYTSEVLDVHDWRRAGAGIRVSDYKYPLHIGTAAGLPGRLLIQITGLAIVLLFATGAFVWLRKHQNRAQSAPGVRRGRPRSRRIPRPSR